MSRRMLSGLTSLGEAGRVRGLTCVWLGVCAGTCVYAHTCSCMQAGGMGEGWWPGLLAPRKEEGG